MPNLVKYTSDFFAIDSIKYYEGFSYEESVYSNVQFPEISSGDLFSIAGNPPKNSSKITADEIKEISRLTKARSAADIELVYSVDKDPLLLFYPLIDKLNLSFDLNLFNSLYYRHVAEIIDHLKFFYNRARPFQIAKELNIKIDRIITKTHHTPSYPSGHTMYAALAAELLIDKYPEHRTKLDAITKQCGLGRVLQGVHYPSDNTAAIKIIKSIFPQLKNYVMER